MGFHNRLYSLFGITINQNQLMSYKTGYPVGGPADYFVTVYSIDALISLVQLCKEYEKPYKILGNGTNVVFSDKGYRGVVISTKGLNSIAYKDGLVWAMSGVSLCDLVLFSAEYQLYGAEQLVGIPASVGGAIVMNAGAFGKSIGDFVYEVVTLVDGKLKRYKNKDCEFGYRESTFVSSLEPIISATFKFERNQTDTYDVDAVIARCRQRRKSDQPLGRSCGCIFKNPPNDFAGRIIDSASLKGLTVGGASVSTKHANFIIANNGAKAQDIYQLVQQVKRKVKNEFGISLTEEVEFVGEF